MLTVRRRSEIYLFIYFPFFFLLLHLNGGNRATAVPYLGTTSAAILMQFHTEFDFDHFFRLLSLIYVLFLFIHLPSSSIFFGFLFFFKIYLLICIYLWMCGVRFGCAHLFGNSCVWMVGNVGNGSNPQLYQTTNLLPAPPSRRLLRNKKSNKNST